MAKVPPYIPFIAVDTAANIISGYPAASFNRRRAYATDLAAELASNGKNWNPVQDVYGPLVPVGTVAVAGAPTITNQNDSTSDIASAVRVTKDDACFTYIGCNLGTWANNSAFNVCRDASNTADVANYMSVTFATDAPVLELYMIRYNTKFMVFVDEQPALDNAIALDAAGSVSLVTVNFGTRKPRNIRIGGFNMPFGGLYIGPTDSVWAVQDKRPLSVALGDSYTQGTGANAQDFVWAASTFRTMNHRYWLEGIGGSGYGSTTTSATDYRMANRMNLLVTRNSGVNTAAVPDNVLWALGYNDAFGGKTQAQIEAGFDAGYAAATYKPNMIIGPWTPNLPTTSTALGNVKTWLTASAATVAARYIDIASIINSGNKSIYTGGDGVHPVQMGHDYLGYRIAQKMRFANP